MGVLTNDSAHEAVTNISISISFGTVKRQILYIITSFYYLLLYYKAACVRRVRPHVGTRTALLLLFKHDSGHIIAVWRSVERARLCCCELYFVDLLRNETNLGQIFTQTLLTTHRPHLRDFCVDIS